MCRRKTTTSGRSTPFSIRCTARLGSCEARPVSRMNSRSTRGATYGPCNGGKARRGLPTPSGSVRTPTRDCSSLRPSRSMCASTTAACTSSRWAAARAPGRTYEAVDMQLAAIHTCMRMFVPRLAGRLAARHADCAQMSVQEGAADLVAVCEMHVTEIPGRVTEEDERCFRAAHRALKNGGFIVWGNAIPDSTWQPCFDYLESIGMRLIEVRDVTPFAIAARDEDRGRVEAFVSQSIDRFLAFRIPLLGRKKGLEARLALENFYRNPGTNLYENMNDGTDTYRVVLLQKV